MTNKLYLGDSSKYKFIESPNANLIYLDPPYGSKEEDNYYGVGENLEQYLNFMDDVLTNCYIWGNPKGFNLILHVDWKAVHYLKVLGDKIFNRKNFKNEIIWTYSSPSVAKSHLPRKHDTLLWWGLGDYVFNIERVPYKKLSEGGKTSWSGKKLDVKSYLDKGMMLQDYWNDIPSLCRNEGEKLHYPTQKPIKLLERIIKMFSNENDLVLDPFNGSGTTVYTAKKLNRKYIGLDISEKSIEITNNRLSSIISFDE